MVFIIFFLFFILIYVALIITFIIGFTKLKRKSVPSVSNHQFLSVVVPCRNEAATLWQLMETLKNQNYPSEKFEVILVNDHSTDDTLAILKTINQVDKRFRPIHLTNNKTGKKAALHEGIKHAFGDIIIITDADCCVPENWLKNIAGYFYDNSLKMLIGAVKIKAKNSFEKLQALEFSALIGSGMGATILNFPFLANGANLAFRKKVFFEVDLKTNYSSGDDIFLLQAIKAKYGTESIRFMTEPSAVVSTVSQKTLKAFFHQRMRWLSKQSGYSDLQTIVISLIVFFANISLLSGSIWIFFDTGFLSYFLACFGFKFLIDFIFLIFTTQFLNQKTLLFFALPLAIIYPVYLFLVSLCSIFITPVWKGRKIQKG